RTSLEAYRMCTDLDLPPPQAVDNNRRKKLVVRMAKPIVAPPTIEATSL
ncbi:hypothetical protein L195_g064450, partial [Trifolium pratense]